MFEQEAGRFCTLIKLLTSLQSIHCGSANNYCDVEKSQLSCLISTTNLVFLTHGRSPPESSEHFYSEFVFCSIKIMVIDKESC